MARVNSGIHPLYLVDQHLVAESVEITMVLGSLRINDFKIKGFEPQQYKLGKGHVNFFKRKIKYLSRRLNSVNAEMTRRGFKVGTSIDVKLYPNDFVNDWNPTLNDSQIVRDRIIQKLSNKKLGFWRYQRNPIATVDNLLDVCSKIRYSDLHEV